MNEEIQMALDDAKDKMEKAIARLEGELSKIRAGKAHPSMLESVLVDYYGSMTPVSQVANVNSTDARTLVVQPWEKAMLDPIATGVINANLGLNPMNNGEVLIINVPPLTEERRKELSKRARSSISGGHRHPATARIRAPISARFRSRNFVFSGEDTVPWPPTPRSNKAPKTPTA